jgi:hypothetical protein
MAVSPEYFPVFGIRIVRGRAFTKLEADEAVPVALVSEATARTLWPGLDPLGQTLQLVPSRGLARGPAGRGPVQRQPEHATVRIIGVTEDVVNGLATTGTDTSCVYFATGLRAPGELSMLVRARRDTAAVRAAVAAAVTALDPNASYQAFSMPELLGVMVWAFDAFSVTASLLGVIGLVLAFSGTYAVVAFLLAQRTREFGIRMAIGASVRQIVAGMMSETMRTASIGLGAGLMVAFALARAFGGVIPIIPAFTVRPYLVGLVVVLAATATAALLPSLRVSRIDPSSALRSE